MPVPPGWEWIEDAEHWDAPEGLRRPVSSVDINLAIRMLSRGTLGNDFNILAGQFISESELFNIWVGATKGTNLDPRELGRHLTEMNQRTRRVYEAWRNLDEGTEGTWEDRLMALKATIQAVIAEMKAERTGR
ncbi:hypothetical protein ACFVYA_15610 [Amycolatopsis sp. NPDC058278]|uniref:hypothetical protein n=1 Tax=Amycolatopsis sp. NPDC058278 TaxID=3346417 RepID=UPI0036DA4738